MVRSFISEGEDAGRYSRTIPASSSLPKPLDAAEMYSCSVTADSGQAKELS